MLRKTLTRRSLEPPKGFEVASWWPPHSHLTATEVCCRLLPGELCAFVYTEYQRHLPGAFACRITSKRQAAEEPETEKAWSALEHEAHIWEETVMTPLTDWVNLHLFWWKADSSSKVGGGGYFPAAQKASGLCSQRRAFLCRLPSFWRMASASPKRMIWKVTNYGSEDLTHSASERFVEYFILRTKTREEGSL